jgi:anti-sigma B factor antagonist
MSIKTTTQQVDSVTVVHVSGRITIGEGATTIRELIQGFINQGNNRILLDLGEVSYIDSTGIGQLVSSFTSVSRNGGQLKLLNLTKKVHDLLQITKLVTVFDIFDSEPAAVQSFGPPQGAA